MALLYPGDPFPALDLNLLDGDTVTLPGALAGRYGVVIFNRGSWCPFCNAQLRGFERSRGELEELGAAVVSLSVDDAETTKALVEKYKLTFPVGHSADPHKFSEATGVFVNAEPAYLQATGFVLDREGKAIVSAYSSGAIGRLTAEDTAGLIRHVRQSNR